MNSNHKVVLLIVLLIVLLQLRYPFLNIELCVSFKLLLSCVLMYFILFTISKDKPLSLLVAFSFIVLLFRLELYYTPSVSTIEGFEDSSSKDDKNFIEQVNKKHSKTVDLNNNYLN
jgi:hypothetical protein